MNARRTAVWIGSILFVLLLVGTLGAVGAFYVGKAIYGGDLPTNEEIKRLPLQVPLRIYTADGKLIGEFGAERRAPVRFEELPPQLVGAFLAAEDERFFEHPGVDWRGLMRAGVNLLLTGEKTQGGSTITMQLARNYFLSNERTYTRKFKEILLALRMERELGKEQILETYLNKIFLGQRAYGVGAAAQIYFGKTVGELSLSQCAVLAGLPKAPSRDNPIDNPARARGRRNYVLGRMLEIGSITRGQYELAISEPVVAELRPRTVEVDAHYVAEMARAEAFERFGEGAYTGGYSIITTLDSIRQAAAVYALRKALLDYQARHRYPGPEGRLPQALAALLASDPHRVRAEVSAELRDLPQAVGLLPAAVVSADPERLQLMLPDGATAVLEGQALDWVRQDGQLPLARGDIVRLHREGEAWRLVSLPLAQGALVSLDPRDGAVQALVGGYDFFNGKFNRAIQARRQPGSGIKPFLYTSALSAGFTPASVILDAPVVFDDDKLEDAWRPKNDSGRFYGPTRLREALVYSRNLVSIRLLQSIGIDYAREFISRFGFDKARMPRDLTLALGTPTFTPLEMARGYSVFANGGFLIEPYWIREIRGPQGEEIFAAEPSRACPGCAEAQPSATPEAAVDGAGREADLIDPRTMKIPQRGAPAPIEAPLAPRAVDPRLVYLADSMLMDVARRGTGARTRELGRDDIAGKTGTTNDSTDAWFFGYHPTLVAVVWVGFDQPASLGRGEYGGRAALPAWIDYMRVALDGVSEGERTRPPGLATVRINRETGRLASAGDPDSIFETVQAEHIPAPARQTADNPYAGDPYSPFGPGAETSSPDGWPPEQGEPPAPEEAPDPSFPPPQPAEDSGYEDLF